MVLSKRYNLILFIISGIMCAYCVYFLFKIAPKPIKDASCDPSTLSIPFIINGVLPKWFGGRNDIIGTVKILWKCTNSYQKENPFYGMIIYIVVYVSLQTFAIPGPIVLSILAGALYPFLKAQLLVAFCATTGASFCYLLSSFLGNEIIHYLFPTMLLNFKKKVNENRDNLFYYILFLRLTPLLPNWFVNIASPICGVDFKYFLIATLLGLIPANFIHISTGGTLMLNIQTNEKDGIKSNNYWNFAILFILQFIALLPTIFKKKIQKYENKSF